MNTLEKHATNIFSKLYGTELKSRFKKLDEEYHELKIEADLYLSTKTHPAQKEKVIDELSDLYVVLIHTANILGVTSDDLIEMGLDKSIGRIINPNYKR